MLTSAVTAVFLLFPLLLSLKLRAKEHDNNGIAMRITLLGFTLYRGVVELRLKNGVLPQIFEIRRRRERLVWSPGMKKGKTGIFFRAAKHVFIIKKFDLDLKTGTGDAAASVLLCGVLDIAADILAHTLSKRLKNAKVNILPDFEKTGVEFTLDCIIVFRVADIIKKVFSLKRKAIIKNASNRKHT